MRYLYLLILIIIPLKIFASGASNNDVVDAAMRRGSVGEILRVADSVSRASRASAGLRAKSFKVRGDHQYILGNYAQAAELYSQAAGLDGASVYKYHHALALAMSGQQSRAAEILESIAVISADSMGGRAGIVLAQLRKNLPVAQSPSTSSTTTTTTTTTMTSTTSTTTTPAFTVQVGAFGSRENADNLQRRLSATYNDVTIQSTQASANGSGGVLHKVRIGTFATRQEAQTFADDLINNAGMTARVVEK